VEMDREREIRNMMGENNRKLISTNVVFYERLQSKKKKGMKEIKTHLKYENNKQMKSRKKVLK
jgi:hypothetical protein